MSATRAGQDNRYPTHEWVADLAGSNLNLAGHICGAWARNVTEGGRKFIDVKPHYLELFQRLQLNISHVLDDLDYSNFYRGLEQFVGPRLIIQIRDTSAWETVLAPVIGKVDILFDCSGGRGILPDYWPRPQHRGLLLPNFGYAGGLAPANLASQLVKMEEASSGQSVWIDVESGVRTGEVLDMSKVERFLDTVAPHVIHGSDNASDADHNQANPTGGSTPPN